MAKDDFDKFGKLFQNKVIQASILDFDFFQKNNLICKPDYFTTDAHTCLWKLITDYYNQYNLTPTYESLKIEIKKIDDADLTGSCLKIVNEIEKNINRVELDHVKDTTHEFCADKEMANAIYDSVDLIKKGKRDAIKGRIEKALRHYHIDSIGHEYFDSLEQRTILDTRKTIPTGWPILDGLDFLDGGLAGGEMGVFMAPTGGGKSFLLTQVGYAALMNKKNVIHYTFELSEVNIGKRYDSRITGLETKVLRDNYNIVQKELEEFDGGKLVIKEFPTKTCNINKIKFHIDRLRASNFDVDLVIIDYADLMRSTKNYDQKVWELEAIYEELRGYSMESGIPIWTASQTNRSGLDSNVVTIDTIADGYVKAQIADFIGGFSRNKFYVAKNRIGLDHVVLDAVFKPEISRVDLYNEGEGEAYGMTDLFNAKESGRDSLKGVFVDFKNKKGLS